MTLENKQIENCQVRRHITGQKSYLFSLNSRKQLYDCYY